MSYHASGRHVPACFSGNPCEFRIDPRLKHSGVTIWGKVIRGLLIPRSFLLGWFIYSRGEDRQLDVIRLLYAGGVTVKPKSLRKVAHKTVRAKRRERAFEQVIAQMAADPAIRAECAVITKDFTFAETDGLKHGLL